MWFATHILYLERLHLNVFNLKMSTLVSRMHVCSTFKENGTLALLSKDTPSDKTTVYLIAIDRLNSCVCMSFTN